MSQRSRAALVTGGSSGIGAAICAGLAADGFRVFSADIAAGQDDAIETLVCDIRSDADVAAAVRQIEDAAGGVDVLVNNAGAGVEAAPIDAVTSAGWDQAFALLLAAPRRLITAAIPSLRRRGGGAIVNVASICGVQPGWGGAAYSVAKAGLIHLTRIAAAELAPDAIRVNAVSPGFIATPLFGRSRGYDREGRLALAEAIRGHAAHAQPLPEAGTPDDVALAVRYLCSEGARFVTGQNIIVDGGPALAPAHMWEPDATSPVLRAIAAGERQLRGD